MQSGNKECPQCKTVIPTTDESESEAGSDTKDSEEYDTNMRDCPICLNPTDPVGKRVLVSPGKHLNASGLHEY